MRNSLAQFSTWLRLVRWPNLLYLVALFVLFRYCLIALLYGRLNTTPMLPDYGFALLLLSVLCIAASGYIINDYLDIEADRINKPEKTIVGTIIPINTALTAYYGLTLVGLLAGFGAGYAAGNIKLGLFQVLAGFMLLQYSRLWKRRPLIGNLIIAFLGALSVLLIAFYERELLAFSKDSLVKYLIELLGYNANWAMTPEAFKTGLAPTILEYIAPYTLFAFLLTLSREVVKAVEDIAGDQAAGYRTLPIAWGMGAARIVALIPLLFSVQFIVQFIARQAMYGDILAIVGAVALVLLPLLYLIWRLWAATTKSNFKHISRFLKVIMFVGLLYLPYLATRLLKMPINGMATYTQQPNIPPNEEIIDMKVDTIIRTGDLDEDISTDEQPATIIEQNQPELQQGQPQVQPEKPTEQPSQTKTTNPVPPVNDRFSKPNTGNPDDR